MNINITDKNWASVDNKDTPQNCDENGTYICLDKNITIVILPHHFKIDANLSNANDGNFTYLSKDLKMAATLDINISAKNKLNNTTQNYTAACYAKDTNFSISYSEINNTLSKIFYQDSNTSDKKEAPLNHAIVFDRNGTLFASENKGLARVHLLINFDRNRSVAVNPFSFHITEINITDANNTEGNTTIDTNTTFYYGRTHAPRQTIIGNEGNISIYYEVYCAGKTCKKTLLQDGINSKTTDDPRWFVNTKHTAQFGIAGTATQKYTDKVTETKKATGNYPDFITLHYNGKRGFPYKTTMDNNASVWLIYNKYNPNAKTNQFEVEFLNANHGWTGKHETNSTTDTNASKRTNRRIYW
ncbi:hypothetical protein MNB_SM-5-1411 [hydrothermal vent metagenome]|uniref:Uncharacterized protein n=1 Tax=hydrothermal vent metagenome TaxID=652676 RepID=A0A1W1C6C4_9ZZZZ